MDDQTAQPINQPTDQLVKQDDQNNIPEITPVEQTPITTIPPIEIPVTSTENPVDESVVLPVDQPQDSVPPAPEVKVELPEVPPVFNPGPVLPETNVPEKINTAPATTIPAFNSDLPLPPEEKKAFPFKPVLLVSVIVLLVVSTALAFYSIQNKKFSLRKEAVGEGQLVCMPVDDAGNLTNEKYRYNRIKVINNTGAAVPVWIQENECPYEGSLPNPPYKCETYRSRRNDTVGVNEEKIYSINVPCQKTGQLDVKKDNDTPLQCFNTVDGREWEGGIAFTIKANPDQCQCAQVNSYASPTSVSPGGAVAFTFTSNTGFTNVAFNPNGGALNCQMDGATCSNNPIAGDPYTCWWRWTCAASVTGGNYTGSFSNSENCPKTINYNVSTAPVATPTPTRILVPTATPTPTRGASPTPTQTPTPIPVGTMVCTSLLGQKVSGGDLSNIKIGETARLTVRFTERAEDVAIRIKKDGVILRTVFASSSGAGPWTQSWSYDYPITASGNYEVIAFVKGGGVWK